MAAKKKTAEEKVLAYLGSRKTPADVFAISTMTGVYTTTVRNALLRLRKKGLVALAGREESRGDTGRPANLYRLA